MNDPFVSDDFFGLVSQVQDQAVADLDKRFAEERQFQDARRAAEGRLNETTMNALLAKDNDDSESRLAALDKEIARVNNEAAEAAKKEDTRVEPEERFPAPILTE